ncbi:hypothetical protein L345_09755, partial [Ophiophagus hannah]
MRRQKTEDRREGRKEGRKEGERKGGRGIALPKPPELLLRGGPLHSSLASPEAPGSPLLPKVWMTPQDREPPCPHLQDWSPGTGKEPPPFWQKTLQSLDDNAETPKGPQ